MSTCHTFILLPETGSVLAIETWLRDSVFDCKIDIIGYNLIIRDRIFTRIGGVYIHMNFSSTSCPMTFDSFPPQDQF